MEREIQYKNIFHSKYYLQINTKKKDYFFVIFFLRIKFKIVLNINFFVVVRLRKYFENYIIFINFLSTSK